MSSDSYRDYLSRLRCAFRLSQPLDALIPLISLRPYFMPLSPVGLLNLQRFSPRGSLRRLSAASAPFTLCSLCHELGSLHLGLTSLLANKGWSSTVEMSLSNLRHLVWSLEGFLFAYREVSTIGRRFWQSIVRFTSSRSCLLVAFGAFLLPPSLAWHPRDPLCQSHVTELLKPDPLLAVLPLRGFHPSCLGEIAPQLDKSIY